MQFISDYRLAFKEACGSYYPIIGLVIAAVIGRLDWLYRKWLEAFQPQGAPPDTEGTSMIFGFPSWILGITFAFGWFLSFMWRRVVHLNRQIRDSRVRIAELRDEGVKIRNKGWSGLTNESWREWEQEALNWNAEIISEMRKISEADATWFSVLDVVPPPRLFPAVLMQDGKIQEDFLKLYCEHDFRLARLGDMIRDLWGSK